MIVGYRTVGKTVKLCKSGNKLPDFFVIGVENMCSILMYMNPFHILCINISCNIRSLVDDQNLFAGFLCFMCKNSSVKPCTYYEIIILFFHGFLLFSIILFSVIFFGYLFSVIFHYSRAQTTLENTLFKIPADGFSIR